MIYTSYFAKYRGDKGVSIALKTPDGFKGKIYSKLAPPYWLLKKYKETSDEIYYIEQYKKYVLDKLDPFEVLKALEDGSVLLCYEKTGSFCHRHIVAAWLREKTGVEIKEL